jgi:hypothetical protein
MTYDLMIEFGGYVQNGLLELYMHAYSSCYVVIQLKNKIYSWISTSASEVNALVLRETKNSFLLQGL